MESVDTFQNIMMNNVEEENTSMSNELKMQLFILFLSRWSIINSECKSNILNACEMTR